MTRYTTNKINNINRSRESNREKQKTLPERRGCGKNASSTPLSFPMRIKLGVAETWLVVEVGRVWKHGKRRENMWSGENLEGFFHSQSNSETHSLNSRSFWRSFFFFVLHADFGSSNVQRMTSIILQLVYSNECNCGRLHCSMQNRRFFGFGRENEIALYHFFFYAIV